MMKEEKLSLAYVRSILHYDRVTGVFTWREQRGRVSPGTPAGTVNHAGYCIIRIDGCLYQASRLAWFYVKKRWPKHTVDHRDTDPLNNRFANLREATIRQNQWNKSVAHCKHLKLKGVFYRARNKRRPYEAQIRLNGQSRYLGSFATRREAAIAYARAARQHFGKFARLQ